MQVTQTPLAGLLVIEPKIFTDNRGYFFEIQKDDRYADLGIPSFKQDNFSQSKKNVLRGLHFQQDPFAQGKLVTVLQGEVWDVAVDIRRSSPTYKQWYGLTLNADNHKQFYIPPGFAHGFCVLSDEAHFLYKCTELYAPQAEHGICWNDPDISIDWPIENPILSEKDLTYPTLREIVDENLFA